MNSTASRPKKLPSSKARRKSSRPVAALCQRRSRQPKTAATIKYRLAFRQWRAGLPTSLERDTLLMPDAIAESVVQEAERFLKADLPPDFAQRLAAKAFYLYPRHKHFHKTLNRPGNRGRNTLYVYMRHWTAGWLHRERPHLYKRLPRGYSLGHALPDQQTTRPLFLVTW